MGGWERVSSTTELADASEATGILIRCLLLRLRSQRTQYTIQGYRLLRIRLCCALCAVLRCAVHALLYPRSTLIHTYCAEADGADADADGDAVLGAGRATFKSPGSFLGTLERRSLL